MKENILNISNEFFPAVSSRIVSNVPASNISINFGQRPFRLDFADFTRQRLAEHLTVTPKLLKKEKLTEGDIVPEEPIPTNTAITTPSTETTTTNPGSETSTTTDNNNNNNNNNNNTENNNVATKDPMQIETTPSSTSTNPTSILDAPSKPTENEPEKVTLPTFLSPLLLHLLLYSNRFVSSFFHL